VSHRLAASSPQISRARARTCSRSISSGADVGPGRSFPVAHRVGWEPLTPTSFASWPPPKASTRKRTLLPDRGSSAALDFLMWTSLGLPAECFTKVARTLGVRTLPIGITVPGLTTTRESAELCVSARTATDAVTPSLPSIHHTQVNRWAPCRAFSSGTGRMSPSTATVGNTTKRRAGR